MDLLRMLQIFTAELMGTTMLIFFGCLGMIYPKEMMSPTLIPILWGFVITAAITMVGHISEAHLNPCVTLSAILQQRIAFTTAIMYVIAQCFGAIAGFLLVKVLASCEIETNGENPAEFCLTRIKQPFQVWQGFLAEFMGTSLLIAVVCSAWDKRNSNQHDSMSIKLGMTVAAIVICIGHISGASLNPARSLGPALVNGVWKNHWVYWVSPISATVVTTLLYEFLYKEEQSVEARHSITSNNATIKP